MKNKNHNHLHLTYSDRCYIEQALSERQTFKQIALFLEKDPSTIAKEVKRNTGPAGRYRRCHSADCAYFLRCNKHNLCNEDISCNMKCKVCHRYDCHKLCKKYVKTQCPDLKKAPYVCNGCPSRISCHEVKYVYHARDAQRKYETTLSDSRKGINSSPDEIELINSLVSPLIKKGQPLSHIYAVHKDEIPCSMRTLYNYLDQGLLDARNLDLPRRVRYKKRHTKKSTTSINNQLYRSHRTYKDFEKFTNGYPEYEVVELDTVKGSNTSGKCLMTLLFRRSNFMLVFLLERCTQDCVIACFDQLSETLGPRLFRKTFHVIITDNGPEFKNPWRIEKDKDGKQRTQVFYCDPYVSNQKGQLEKNHEFIRYILPKGRSMHFLDQEKVNLMTSHINSIARESLNGSSPFELAELLLDKKIPALLGLKKVSPDEVHLKPVLLKK